MLGSIVNYNNYIEQALIGLPFGENWSPFGLLLKNFWSPKYVGTLQQSVFITCMASVGSLALKLNISTFSMYSCMEEIDSHSCYPVKDLNCTIMDMFCFCSDKGVMSRNSVKCCFLYFLIQHLFTIVISVYEIISVICPARPIADFVMSLGGVIKKIFSLSV